MSKAGNTGTSLPKKLGLVGDVVFTVVEAPPDFATMLGEHGDAIWQRSLLAPIDVVVVFAATRAKLGIALPKVTPVVVDGGSIWVAWPKPSSGLDTDLNDESLKYQMGRVGWADDKAVSIDDTWSALRFAKRKVTLRPKDRAKR